MLMSPTPAEIYDRLTRRRGRTADDYIGRISPTAHTVTCQHPQCDESFAVTNHERAAFMADRWLCKNHDGSGPTTGADPIADPHQIQAALMAETHQGETE